MGFLDKFISKEAQEKIKSTVQAAAEAAEEKIKEAAEIVEEKKKESDSPQSAYSPSQVAANNGETYSVSNAPRLIKKHSEPVIPYTDAVGSDVSKKRRGRIY